MSQGLPIYLASASFPQAALEAFLNAQLTPEKPTLLIYSGPSGVGKGSILKGIKGLAPQYYENPAPFFEFEMTVSMTTRAPRPGERDGVDYRFVSREAFEDSINAGELLEWKPSGDGSKLYGTPKSEVRCILAAGKLPVLEIETEGKKELEAQHAEAFNLLSLFVMPPCSSTPEAGREAMHALLGGVAPGAFPRLATLFEAGELSETALRVCVLLERLQLRGTEHEAEVILKRLDKGLDEMTEAQRYQLLVENTRLSESVPTVQRVFEMLHPLIQHLEISNKTPFNLT